MYVISIYFFIVMVKKMLEKMIRTAQENLKALDLGSEEKKKSRMLTRFKREISSLHSLKSNRS